jgi:hypothetical protein
VHTIQNAGISAHPAAIGIKVRLAGHTTTSLESRRWAHIGPQPEVGPQLSSASHRISRLARLGTEANHNHCNRPPIVSLLPIVVGRRFCRCCRYRLETVYHAGYAIGGRQDGASGYGDCSDERSDTRCCTLLYVVVRCCTLLYVVVRCCTLLYVVVRCCCCRRRRRRRSVGQSLASDTHLLDFRYRARDPESKREARNRL